MKYLRHLKVISIASSIVLSACGGSGSSTPEPSPSSSPISTPSPSPISTPSPSPSPTPAPVTPVMASLDVFTTKMGATYTVDGMASVTVRDGSDFLIVNQDKTDFSLYIFDNDPVGESVCNSESCIQTWPPLIATENDVAVPPFSIIDRDEGSRQWALRGKPVYFFAGDLVEGDVNGEGVGDVWHAAQPSPTLYSDNVTDGVFFIASGSVSVSSQNTSTVFSTATVNMEGFSLYTFDIDEEGVSNCNDNCLAVWPALLADVDDVASPPYSLIERQLGSTGPTAMQWAYNDMPLYFYAGDVNAGDTNGQAIPSWRLARPTNSVVVDTVRGSHFAVSGLSRIAASDSVNPVEAPSHGLSLYTFDNDASGVSNCSGGCLANWPALIAYDGAEPVAPFSLVERGSGQQQWALNGLPLYTFIGDSAAGDVNGDGSGGNWHLARIAPVAVRMVSLNGNQILALSGHGELIDEAGAADTTHADFTLYTFDDDTATGLPTCYAGCAIIWPPLFAKPESKSHGDFTVVRRDDPNTTADDTSNILQWSYKGQPLYFVASDSAPDQTNGEYGTWHVAVP